MRKIFIFMLVLASLFVGLMSSSTKKLQADTKPTVLKIHYFRFNDDYQDGWSIWLWQKAPTDGAGVDCTFDKDASGLVYDDFGVVATIDLTSSSFKGATRIGVIMKKGSWEQKDISVDRFIDIPEQTNDGVVNVYFVEDDERIGYSIDDPQGPERKDKIRYAYFQSETKIVFGLTKAINKDDISLLIGGELATNCTINLNKSSGIITLYSKLDFNNSYIVQANIAGETMSYAVTYDGIYDSKAFNDAFYYSGNDLGSIPSQSETTFRLWAPISKSVVLNIYASGTPQSLGGTDEAIQTVPMQKDVKGTWFAKINQNLHGYYYTYSVTNGSTTYEVVDPYAKSAGVNGLRGMIIDFAKINPNGFSYNKRAQNINKETDAIVYELHVRDLTSHSSWNGKEEYRGKFLGLTEKGTRYQGATTGLDHIIELGVTHVQLIPIFDHGAVDESRLNDTKYKQNGIFNWGYMPENYNVPEGSYSSDPYDGITRVVELKQTTTSLVNNNINVVMDVVYNHTGKSGDSNLNLIVPGYYYRMNEDGSFSNGSGCGNETASERLMMRKFMVDSVVFWATEYNIAGFRFDLMALHDTDTMNEIATKLKAIDKNILIYGEPWNGGTTPIDGGIAADKVNLAKMPNIGAFNDDMRDAIKGSVFDAAGKGFIQGDISSANINKIKYGIVGGVNHKGVSSEGLSYNKVWHTSPSKTINYVSAHDNNTLYDKIMLSTTNKQKDARIEMQKQANAIVLTSQGIVFIHAGAEFMRSKPKEGGGYDSNSYTSPDSTNQLRWDKKVGTNNTNVFNYYKQLIAFRKAHPAFRLGTAEEVNNSIEFLDNLPKGVIAYTISTDNISEADSYKKILVIHNSNALQLASINIPEGKWTQVANCIQVGEEIKDFVEGDKINVFANETAILYLNVESHDSPAKKGCFKNTQIVEFISLMSLLVASVYVIKKR